MNHKFSTYHICVIAFAIVINIIGGQLALMLQLPIYLDCIGTVLTAALCGWFYAMVPNLLSGLIFGMISDIYSLYYAPVGILLGALIGIVWKKKKNNRTWLFSAALIVTVPTSMLSACITSWLFGGITSSGSTFIVQLLAKTPIGLTMSCFIVQLFTDYIDRLVALFLVNVLWKKLPKTYRNQMEG